MKNFNKFKKNKSFLIEQIFTMLVLCTHKFFAKKKDRKKHKIFKFYKHLLEIELKSKFKIITKQKKTQVVIIY